MKRGNGLFSPPSPHPLPLSRRKRGDFGPFPRPLFCLFPAHYKASRRDARAIGISAERDEYASVQSEIPMVPADPLRGCPGDHAGTASSRRGDRAVRRFRPASSPFCHARSERHRPDYGPADLSQLWRRPTDAGAVPSPSNTPPPSPNTMTPLARRRRPAPPPRFRPAGTARHPAARSTRRALRRRSTARCSRRRRRSTPMPRPGTAPVVVVPQDPYYGNPQQCPPTGTALYPAAGARTGLSLHAGRYLGLPLVRGPRQQSRRAGHQRY